MFPTIIGRSKTPDIMVNSSYKIGLASDVDRRVVFPPISPVQTATVIRLSLQEYVVPNYFVHKEELLFPDTTVNDCETRSEVHGPGGADGSYAAVGRGHSAGKFIHGREQICVLHVHSFFIFQLCRAIRKKY